MNETKIRSILIDRLQVLEERIRTACEHAGRPRADVTLIAVTKSVGSEIAKLLPELGLIDLGENRPQALWTKAASLPTTVRWHLIGHLQRNKVAQTLPLVYLTHSVDSLRLLDAIESASERIGRTADVLLEINASHEASKGGFAPTDVPALAERVRDLKHVRVCGLMTMAALTDDPAKCRPTFTELRHLRDRLQRDIVPTHQLEHLSMGMSGDFEIAIAEGATIIRVGSALFEGIDL